ncbi:MAG: CPBP family intramembrane metalloprotease [Bacteroidetes bacterium]|nr:CPBP family intramembrane metalloprotease [Bacteroidota bacterium]
MFDFHRLPPSFQIFLFLFIVLFSSLLFLIGGYLVLLFYFDINLFENESVNGLLADPAFAGKLKFLQLIQHLGTFIAPPLVFALLINRSPFSFLSLHRKPAIILCLTASFSIIALLPFVNYLALINGDLSLPDFLSPVENWMRESEQSAQNMAEQFLKAHTITDLFVNLLIIAIVPAIGEELVFRGVIQQIAIKITGKIIVSIIITAFLFSALHMQFFTFLPRFILGIILGYVFYASGNLWVSICAHFANNGFGVVAYYLMEKNLLTEENLNPDTIGIGQGQWWVALFSAVAALFFLFPFYGKKPLSNEPK